MESIFVAEMVGTAILILLGDGVVAAVLLNESKAQNSGWIVITLGWAMAVAVAVYAVAQFSGAHINPAVTIGLAATDSLGELPATGEALGWGDVPIYLLGQFAGAFLGACLVFLAYLPHWGITEDPGLKLAVFSTGPAVRNPAANFVTEVIGTAMLLIGVMALGFGANADSIGAVGLTPLLVGFLVLAIGLSLGGPTGYAINPARDLGPRIAHQVLPIAGKGDSDWSYAWIPVVAPIVGGVLGAFLFKALWP
ncbi:MAG TPA: MIP/aquaporin family protein [Pyrinomonadaceae bacterium]|nr:MIP/aquaporin family protein [Pyrinomonadaceae bacterium]